ncbi:MAG TPA: terminase family protein [Ktedonobacterales bacterium]|jgi:phage terminase large subunit-like protein|nr:terminase family protein [Ktedonobacterales bacterium]
MSREDREDDEDVRDAAAQPLALDWSLNPAQWAFVHSQARFSLYVGGIGAGKTFAGAVRTIVRALEDPGSLGLVGAPTYAMLRDTTERALTELLPRQAIRRFYRSERRIALRNGTEILLRSLDQPDFARGLNLAWFWLDEAPLCGYYAWEVLKGRLRQPGHATAAWATGTPHGRDGFARDFELAPRRSHALYRASTWANAHNLPSDFVSDLGYSGAFEQQEVYGLFVAFEGLVYTLDRSADGVVREPPVRGVASWARVIGGVDWGYTNPAAALVFARSGDGDFWQIAEFYQRRASLEETLLPQIVALTRQHAVEEWYCGPDEPEHIEALRLALARAGLRARVTRADNAVRAGIQTVTGLLARRPDGRHGLCIAPGMVHTLAEYDQYRYASAPSGRDPAEQPVKQNDHALDATRYALHSELARQRAASQTDRWLADLKRRGE